jgi:hypothetical protein
LFNAYADHMKKNRWKRSCNYNVIDIVLKLILHLGFISHLPYLQLGDLSLSFTPRFPIGL